MLLTQLIMNFIHMALLVSLSVSLDYLELLLTVGNMLKLILLSVLDQSYLKVFHKDLSWGLFYVVFTYEFKKQ